VASTIYQALFVGSRTDLRILSADHVGFRDSPDEAGRCRLTTGLPYVDHRLTQVDPRLTLG
jgi:hypothetical protein